MKCINAFMNTEGGTLHFGVADSGTIVGFPLDRIAEDKLKLDIDRIIKCTFPRFQGRVEVEVVAVPLSRPPLKVVKIHVQRDAGDHPTYYCYYGGNAFERLNASIDVKGSTEFVEASQLFQARVRIAELEAQVPGYVAPPEDSIERHLRDMLNIKSAKKFADRYSIYSSLDEKTLREVQEKDLFIKELKSRELEALHAAAEQEKEYLAVIEEQDQQIADLERENVRLREGCQMQMKKIEQQARLMERMKAEVLKLRGTP
jgi:predicted HTH transcriptional regulator